MKKMRLDRFLANSGCGTRSEVKKQIRSGAVTVDGTAERDPGKLIAPEEQEVRLGGGRIAGRPPVYRMLYKCAGTVTATRDSRLKTVMDLLPDVREDAFPVGRLDRDTEGLLLITSDGALGHRLTSPAWHAGKVYEAVVTGTFRPEMEDAFAKGLEIGDEKPTLGAKLQVIEEPQRCAKLREAMQRVYGTQKACDPPAATGGVCAGPAEPAYMWYARVELREGRYHQVKRMFAAVGEQVLYLRRVEMGPLKLDETLAPGESRPLTEEEIHALMDCTDLGSC